MPYRPTRRQNTLPGATPYRRRPSVEGARRARPLFARSRVARAGNVLARCKAALACFGAAALVLALALALPLAASPSAAADVDLEARAAAEAAQLQAAAELPRSASLDVPALQQFHKFAACFLIIEILAVENFHHALDHGNRCL